VVKRYAMTNVSRNSYTTINHATKTLASSSDCIIFLFLGMSVTAETHTLHWGFIFTTALLCTVVRCGIVTKCNIF
jgi:hypothetical protein